MKAKTLFFSPLYLLPLIITFATGCRTARINNLNENRSKDGLVEISMENFSDKASFFIWNRDIITEKKSMIAVNYIPELGKHHNWVQINSPGLYSITPSLTPERDTKIYLTPGKTLNIHKDSKGNILFSGEIGEINTFLYYSPQFDALKEINQRIERDSLYTPQQALIDFDREFALWEAELKEYISTTSISPLAKRILSYSPMVTKSLWLLNNETYLGLENREDFKIIEDILRENDGLMAAQFQVGGIPIKLITSKLLNRFKFDNNSDIDNSLKGKIRKYFKRYDGLLTYFELTEMPDILQLAVAHTLCVGGLLEEASTKEEALDIVKSLSDYMPNIEIRKKAEQYAKFMFNEGDMDIPENAGGKVLKEIAGKYAGKNVVLDFWAPHCRPCLSEMKQSREVREKNRDNADWVIVYITSQEVCTPEEYKKFTDDLLAGDESYYLNHDNYSPLAGIFKVQALPRHLLIGRDGKIESLNYEVDFEELRKR